MRQSYTRHRSQLSSNSFLRLSYTRHRYWTPSCRNDASPSNETSFMRHSYTRRRYEHLHIWMLLRNQVKQYATILHATPLYVTYQIFSATIRHATQLCVPPCKTVASKSNNSLCLTFLHATPKCTASCMNDVSKPSDECFLRQSYTRHRYVHLRAGRLHRHQVNIFYATVLHATPLSVK